MGRAFAGCRHPRQWRLLKVETQEDTYHSEMDSVYHALAHCPVGRMIPDELRSPGTGGRVTMCPACEARLTGRRRSTSGA